MNTPIGALFLVGAGEWEFVFNSITGDERKGRFGSPGPSIHFQSAFAYHT